MPNVSLTPELERFAEERVRSGRYNNVSEVMRSALRMLQDYEAKRDAFIASLEEAVAEGDRTRFYSIEELGAEMDAVIEAAQQGRA